MKACTTPQPWRSALAVFTVLGLALAHESIAPWFSRTSLDPRAALVMLALSAALTALGFSLREAWRDTGKKKEPGHPILLSLMHVVFGAYLTPPGGMALHWLLLPVLVVTGAITVLALSPRPHHGWTRGLVIVLGTTRWLYLGGLIAATSLVGSAGPSILDLGAYALIFLGLGWATRGIGRIDQRRFPGQQNAMRALYQAQTDFTLFELCLILTLSLLLGTSSRLSVGDGLVGYLALLAANALLIRLIVEGSSLEPTPQEKALGSCSRVFTVLVLVVLVSVFALEEIPKGEILPVLFSLLALGIVRGRPWGSQPAWTLPSQDDPENDHALPRKGPRIGYPLAAALLCLGISFATSARPETHQDYQNPHLLGQASQLRLQAAAGWRFRIQESSDIELLLTYQKPARWEPPVAPEEFAAATEAVACSNCGPRVTIQQVPLGLWERLAANVGWPVIVIQLGLIPVLLGWLRPRENRLWTGGLMLLAGVIAALTLAAAWGWIWTDARKVATAATYVFLLAVVGPSALYNRLRGFGRFPRQGTEGS